MLSSVPTTAAQSKRFVGRSRACQYSAPGRIRSAVDASEVLRANQVAPSKNVQRIALTRWRVPATAAVVVAPTRFACWGNAFHSITKADYPWSETSILNIIPIYM